MANLLFNVAKGRWAEWASLAGTANAELLAVLLKAGGEADAGLVDRGTLADVLSASTEADFTNYARKVLSVTVTVDDANNRVDVAASPATWTAAGGAVNNATGRFLIVFDPDTTSSTDADRIPISAHDFTVVTDGTDVEAEPADVGGVVARAS